MIERPIVPELYSLSAFAALSALILLTACSTLKETHLNMVENGKRAHDEVTKLVTPADTELCAKKISEQTGTFGNTRLQLTGPVEPDSRMTCLAYYSATMAPSVPTAYYSAPTKLVSGWGGIGLTQDSSTFWCEFHAENGKVTLARTGVGVAAAGILKSNPIDAGITNSTCKGTS